VPEEGPAIVLEKERLRVIGMRAAAKLWRDWAARN
jgi:hypothetical protein